MKIAHRCFIIPETIDEVALCMNTKNLHMISINYKDKTFSVWTEDETNDSLLNNFLSEIDHNYYFESILLEEDSNVKTIAKFIVNKSKPEIIIDIRADPGIGFKIDEVKSHINRLSEGKSIIRYRWVPKLGQKESFNDGIFEVKQILRSNRRILFIGDRTRLMNKICRILRSHTEITNL